MSPPAQPSPTRALCALLGGALGIACAPLFVRASELPATSTAFWRVLLAAPVLALLAGLTAQRRPATARPSGSLWWLLLPGVFFAGDLALWHQALHDTTIAHATLLANGAPLVVTLGAWLWLGERITRRFLIALGIALVGVVLLTDHSAGQARAPLRGDLFGMGTAVFYGSYLLSVRRLRAAGWPAAALMAVASLTSALVLLPLALALGDPLLPPTANGWRILIGLALVSHVGGQGLIAWALAHLPASYSALALLSQPVLVGAAGWWLFAEHLGGVQLVGAALVMGAAAWAHRDAGLRSAGAPSGGPPAPRSGG